MKKSMDRLWWMLLGTTVGVSIHILYPARYLVAALAGAVAVVGAVRLFRDVPSDEGDGA